MDDWKSMQAEPRRFCHPAWFMTVGLVLVAVTMFVGTATALDLAMVADNAGDRVVVFDTANDAVVGSVTIGSGSVGDCSVSGRRGLGYVTAHDGFVWVIDLSSSTPVLAAGTNPIPISNQGWDTALTPDERFLVVCSGGVPEGPVSVVDLATRTEVDSFDPGHGCTSVDVCSDGSVLIGLSDIMNNVRIVRRLTIDASGTLTDTGVTWSADDPQNLTCASGGATAVVLGFGGEARSFTVPNLVQVDSVTSSLLVPVDAQISADGQRLFTRFTNGVGGTSTLNAHAYNPVSGAIGESPVFEVPLPGIGGDLGWDRLVLHPAGTKLYVSEPGAVAVYDANSGAFLHALTDQDIVDPTGLCVAAPVFVDGFESGSTTAWSQTQGRSQVPISRRGHVAVAW